MANHPHNRLRTERDAAIASSIDTNWEVSKCWKERLSEITDR